MTKVTLSAPRPGLNKVRLTKSLCADLGLHLSEAKRLTDRVADGHLVEVTTDDRAAAEQLAQSAQAVGAVAVVDELAAA